MQTINVRETREKLSSLLDAVLAGEEIVILRNGKPAARLTAPPRASIQFPDRTSLRATLPPCHERASQTVRTLRDEERF
jgi:prevent-host-death family protein